MKMTRISTIVVLVTILFWAPTQMLLSQKPIYGNKNITENKRMVANFHQVTININGNIIIHSSEQAHVLVKTDENLQKNIITRVNAGILSIDQKKWPEPSQKFEVHVYAPIITKIESESWANVKIFDLRQEKLTINMEMGTLEASGSVEKLIVTSKQGDFDLSKLKTEEANITLTSYAKAELCCAEKLVTSISKKAKFRVNDKKSEKSFAVEKPVYIDLKIRNNQVLRNHFVVRGPASHPFSYGFAMLPFTSKSERWPIGTQVFQESLSGKETLLVEFTEKDAGKTINLVQ